ncbi:hypothetical protein C8A05DRAFT_43188 [Staphylotrichum tortipilum]|uniref:SH3 domain-containing protein n=1 Tax=Staphylotrichum tortipilum TaxID=2831512 RepID=A0AAN6MMZ8_9PEZI|nr:hypothetical protein C8A05DRAFT_43188 [Staphylotrichum longicolle]
MAVDAEDLLIRPFRDVVAVGNTALTNASASSSSHADIMSRAAQALVREGERALTKVQLIWQDRITKHGSGFSDMMVQQASLETRRLQLEDLLWDFDDFTHLDDFDPTKYAALQAATKAFALDIIDTAKRLHVVEPNTPAVPAGGFPPLPPLPAWSGPASRPPSVRSVGPRRMSKPRITPDAGQPHDRDPSIASQNDSVEDDGAAKRTTRSQSVAHPSSQPFNHDLPRGALTPPASPGMGPVVSRFPDLSLNTTVRPRTFDPAPSPSTVHTRTSVLSNTSTSSSAYLGSLDSLVITEDVASMERPSSKDISGGAPLAARSPIANAADHDILGVEDLLRESSNLSDRRKSRPASPRIPDCSIREDSTYYKLKGFCRGATRFRKDGHWDSIKLTNENDYGSGGGAFVGGDMMRASDGITVPFQYEMSRVGACGDCGYAHDLDEVELDRTEAVRTSESGARYRLRLLFKSHIRQASSTDTHYACLWCIQAAVAARESDATVFRSADDLVRHLGRHSQPLPSISGVSVAYGPLPESAPLDFDLHLPETPSPVPMPENVARLATAVAVRDHYRRPGRGKLEKPPKYEADMLEFMEGARIVGIIFPEKWGGKYCLGRHDGEFGAFPAKAIDLRPPQETEIPVGGENGMSVTTRWRWQPPTTPGAPWLQFGKGEVITNVQCLYADYWCWSGTNSKGKTGVFPQSHIDLQTLRGQEAAPAKKSKGRGLFGRSNSKTAETAKGNGYRNSIAS